MSRNLATFVLVGSVALAGLLVPAPTLAADRSVSVQSSSGARQPDRSTVVRVRLPAGVAAVDGRVLVHDGAAEVVGVVPVGRGRTFRPVEIAGGAAFGVFDMRPSGRQTFLDVVLVPLRTGDLQVRVLVDAAADRHGRRIQLTGVDQLTTVRVAGGFRLLAAPRPIGRTAPTRPAGLVRERLPDGRFDKRDLDTVRAGWEAARAQDGACAAAKDADVNGDGCVDILDVQATLAMQGESSTGGRLTTTEGLRTRADTDTTAAASAAEPTATATGVRTFTVISAADTPDSAPGNGTCADAAGQCTLRAALTEADYLIGEDRIEFALAGTAPVLIQLSGSLPIITSRSGGVIIDGYSQPGSRPNDASFGSNAVTGVEIRGNGAGAKEYGFRVNSPGNTLRGLLIHNIWRPIMLDGANARQNRIVGNWLGFKKDGTLSTYGNFGVTLNVGANSNAIGSPALADRNVIGNHSHAIENYGAGVDGNVIQNNLLCIRPSGIAGATCANGIDHNFGPKNSLIGGLGPNERNVIGPTSLQCIELSHGWDRSLPYGTDTATTYQISGHRVIGNWAGFRGDGRYDSSFRCGLNFSSADNGQAINVYDGSNDNLVEGNYVASVYDGIQVMSTNSTRNIVRGNIIGESPLGEPAPLTRWGVVIRWGTTYDVVEGNTIRNAAAGGVGLLNTNNRGEPISPAYNVRISRNIVTNTNGPAIDLFGVAGPEVNDAGDADQGANTLLNTPEFTSATTTRIAGTASSGATVEVYRASRPAGQHGLPVEFLGSTLVGTNGTWSLSAALANGDQVTALQIGQDENTSELAANVAVTTGASNSAPVLDSVSISPTSPRTNQTLSLTVVASDPDGDTLTYAYQWTKNGSDIAGATGATLDLGTAGNGDRGDTIRVRVTASDGTATSDPVTSSPVTVANSAPSATVALSPRSPGSDATLTATATSSDADGDPVNLRYVWQVNGVSRRTTDTTALTDTFELSADGNGDANDGVSVAVTPSDDGLSGTTVADSVTVASSGPTVYASDPFGRTVVDGWGSASTGGSYTLQGSAGDFDVTGSAGTIALTAAGANRSAVLAGVSALDVDLSFRVATDKSAAGGSQFVYGIVRRTTSTSGYRAKIRLAPDGAVFIQAGSVTDNKETSLGSEVRVSGLTHTPGAFIQLRVQATGSAPTTLRMRAWAGGSSEPTTWQYTVTDSTSGLQSAGGVGLRAYLGSATTNAPLLVTFDDFRATGMGT